MVYCTCFDCGKGSVCGVLTCAFYNISKLCALFCLLEPTHSCSQVEALTVKSLLYLKDRQSPLTETWPCLKLSS